MKKKLLLEENLQKYGLEYHNILEKEKGIKIKNIDDYYLYRYNQLDENCNFADEITQECRSIIYKYNSRADIEPKDGNSDQDIEPKFKRVCVPFYKFFNYNEEIVTDLYNRIKDKELYAYEKIDGAMIMLWFDEYWHISTSGNINAHEAPISNSYSKFKNYEDMFVHCAEQQNLDFDKLDKNCTYIFEMIGKYIRIVVPYDYIDGKIYHIGTRNNITLEENFDDIGIVQPRVFKTKGMYDIMKYIDSLTTNDENFEGLVVRDDDYNRLKVKPDIYFHLSCLNNNGDITPKRIVKMIMSGEDTELLAYFPEYTKEVQEWRDKKTRCYEKLENEIKQLIEKRNSCLPQNRKELVLRLTGNYLKGFILQAASDIYNEVLTEKEKIHDYAKEKLDLFYQNRQRGFIELIDKF